MSLSAEAGPISSAKDEKQAVFISYSRSDAAFADEIAGGLEYGGGFEVLIDRRDIHEAENWQERLGALIVRADSVVFILTPRSATSPICRWEVDEAIRLSKRVIPILAATLGDTSVPQPLAALNYVRFDPSEDGRPRSFIAALAGLRRALNTDLAWVREHTRLLGRAHDWDAAGRPENRLLSGGDIAIAKGWLDQKPKEAPTPTELHRDFIQASERAETARNSVERARVEALEHAVRRARRSLVIAVIFAVVGLASAAIAFLEKVRADSSAREAQLTSNKLTIANRELTELQKFQASAGYKKIESDAKQATADVKDKKARYESEATFATLANANVKLVSPIAFIDTNGRVWKVPAGYVFSGASVPSSLWSVVGSPFDPQFLQATALHDYYASNRERPFEEVNRMFFEALIASGVAENIASTLYAGVLVGGSRW